MLDTLSSIQSCPTYVGGQLIENTSHYENWTVHCHLYKYAMESVERGGWVGKQVSNPVTR